MDHSEGMRVCMYIDVNGHPSLGSGVTFLGTQPRAALLGVGKGAGRSDRSGAAGAVSAAMPCPCSRVGRATVAAVVIADQHPEFAASAGAAVNPVVAS